MLASQSQFWQIQQVKGSASIPSDEYDDLKPVPSADADGDTSGQAPVGIQHPEPEALARHAGSDASLVLLTSTVHEHI